MVTQDNPGWDDETSRAAIDGRAAFATAIFLFSLGVFILLDRIGAPERMVALLGPVIALIGLAALGFLLRSMRISSFHAAGRAAPGGYAGLAMAALAATLATPFTPPTPMGASIQALLLGLGMGLALAGLGVGPMLRKTGAFSMTDLLASRFPNMALKIGSLLFVSLASLCVGLAGLSMALQGLNQATAMGPVACAIFAAALVAVIVVPGGLAGLVWSATGAGGLLIAGVAAPLVVIIASGATIPLPVLGDRAAFAEAVARIEEWQSAVSLPGGHDRLIVVAIALGLGGLAPLLAPAIATQSPGEARRGGLMGLVCGGLLGLMALAVMAASALALQSELTGLRPADTPGFLLEASGRGVIWLCGRHPATLAQVREACEALPGFSGVLSSSDIVASGDYLLLGVTRLRGFGPAFSGLAMAGRISAALVLSAAGFLTLATALGHDAFYRMHAGAALSSRRLAVTRLILLVAIATSALLLLGVSVNPATLIGLALGLSAVTMAPLLLLTLWPRATGQDAAIALVAGVGVAEIALLLAGGSPSADLSAGAVVTGFVAALIAGVGASFLHSPDPTSPGEAFLHGLLHQDGDVLGPDKGA